MARDPDGKCFKAITAAKYIAISKPKSDVPGDIRPIGITSVLRRIYGKYVMFESKDPAVSDQKDVLLR